MGWLRIGGYGEFCAPSDKHVFAHRAAWEMYRGQIPQGACVLHRCDVRSCVNPDHLWLGSKGENNKDMAAKGRARNANMRKTHCPAGHEYTPENTKVSGSNRHCKICRHIQSSMRSKALTMLRGGIVRG